MIYNRSFHLPAMSVRGAECLYRALRGYRKGSEKAEDYANKVSG